MFLDLARAEIPVRVSWKVADVDLPIFAFWAEDNQHGREGNVVCSIHEQTVLQLQMPIRLYHTHQIGIRPGPR